jgi:hypothetical protein
MRSVRTAIAALIAATLLGPAAFAAELQMYRRVGCPWCAAWDREVGPIYPKTDIGRRIPLRMIDLDRERPRVALKTPVIYTPTFILVENDREIGRIEGFAGDAFFWGLLGQLVQRLKSESRGGSLRYPLRLQTTGRWEPYESASLG